jgi:hypothetical protein
MGLVFSKETQLSSDVNPVVAIWGSMLLLSMVERARVIGRSGARQQMAVQGLASNLLQVHFAWPQGGQP